MNVEFLATVAMIAPDPANGRKLYVETQAGHEWPTDPR